MYYITYHILYVLLIGTAMESQPASGQAWQAGSSPSPLSSVAPAGSAPSKLKGSYKGGPLKNNVYLYIDLYMIYIYICKYIYM